ncbi:MAG: hypothetical protein GXO05_02855 [Aquificae bacterium]|nr:hypothetical protein [Aquificota bacterium]
MDKQTDRSYYEEIVSYIKKITGYNLAVSPKDRQVIEKLIKNQIPVEIAKQLIKKEVLKYPPEKRKKFRLSSLEPKLKELSAKKAGISRQDRFTSEIPEELKDTYSRLKKLNNLWKSLPEEEKKQIINTAVKKMKKSFILSNIDRQKVLKSIIREILAERYNIK